MPSVMTLPMPKAYLTLARKRAASTCCPYKQPEAFGYDFREWVSPYTKGAHKLGGIALVLQDWASEDGLSGPKNCEIQAYGRTPGLRTNRNLEQLLERVFRLSLADVYATNAFPFVKPGSMSGPLRRADVNAIAKCFLFWELNIAKPKVVLALGAVAYAALHHVGISCVRLPHPAARIGGIDKHEQDWRTALGGCKSTLPTR